MTRSKMQVLAACMFLSPMAGAEPTATAAESRGEMLYATHCIGCHSTQVHWRDKKLVTDWSTLKAQVRRWSSNTALAWDEDDIVSVARYLNTRYYQFSLPDRQMGRSPLWQGPTLSTSFTVPMAYAKY